MACSARARVQSTPTAASAACVGVEQLTAATSSSKRAVGVVADGRDHRHAEQRDGSAQGLIAEAQQVGQRAAATGDDRDLDAADRHELAERLHDRGRRVAILHGRERPHQPSRPAAPRERRAHVVARLAALAGDHADCLRQHRHLQALLGLQQTLAVELLA